jgi:hypothetical protein
MEKLKSIKVEPHEWAKFHLKIWFDAADYDYEDGWHGHNDRLVMEWFDKVDDKYPVERLYFEFESSPYKDEPDATDAIKELLDSVEWDLDMAEGITEWKRQIVVR